MKAPLCHPVMNKRATIPLSELVSGKLQVNMRECVANPNVVAPWSTIIQRTFGLSNHYELWYHKHCFQNFGTAANRLSSQVRLLVKQKPIVSADLKISIVQVTFSFARCASLWQQRASPTWTTSVQFAWRRFYLQFTNVSMGTFCAIRVKRKLATVLCAGKGFEQRTNTVPWSGENYWNAGAFLYVFTQRMHVMDEVEWNPGTWAGLSVCVSNSGIPVVSILFWTSSYEEPDQFDSPCRSLNVCEIMGIGNCAATVSKQELLNHFALFHNNDVVCNVWEGYLNSPYNVTLILPKANSTVTEYVAIRTYEPYYPVFFVLAICYAEGRVSWVPYILGSKKAASFYSSQMRMGRADGPVRINEN